MTIKLPEKVARELICDLNQDEVRTYSEDLARITTLHAEAEDEKKAITSSFKDKIDRFVADMRSFARKISTRQETRQVECVYRYDAEKGDRHPLPHGQRSGGGAARDDAGGDADGTAEHPVGPVTAPVFQAAVAHDLMPHPRQVHNKKALGISRGRVTNKAVARTLDYLANRDELAWKLKVSAGLLSFPKGMRLRANVTVWLAHNRLPDKDNLDKTVFDALKESGVIVDDRWIRAGETIIHDGAAKGMVAVDVRML